MTDIDTEVQRYIDVTGDLQLLGGIVFGEEGYDDVDERPAIESLHLAQAIGSQVKGANPFGPQLHKLVVDLDVPVVAVPSSTEGHWHLIIDHEIAQPEYFKLLEAMVAAGLVEEGYVSAADRRGYTCVRTPWELKDGDEVIKERRELAGTWKAKVMQSKGIYQKPTGSLRIGIDLDGVLYDFANALREYMVEELGWHWDQCPDAKEWTFYRSWGLTDEGFKIVCDNAADDGKLWGSRTGMGLWEQVKQLKRLRAAGHTVHIITDRQFGSHPGVSHKATAKWLAANSIPYDTLTFAADKTIIRTDYMIEDKPENYDALEAAGTKAFLLTRPWNEAAEGKDRVTSVREFVDTILKEPSA